MVGPLRVYPPYTNGLVIHAIFFKSYNSLKQIFTIFFPTIFGPKKPDLLKKSGSLLRGRVVYPPYTLRGPTTKKTTFFMFFFPQMGLDCKRLAFHTDPFSLLPPEFEDTSCLTKNLV